MNALTTAARIILVGALFALALGLARGPALAAYTARVEAGTLKLTSRRRGERQARRSGSSRARPNTLQVDVGERRHGRLQLRPHAPSRRSTSTPAAATTSSASTRAAARSPTRPSRWTAAPATTR